MTDISYLCDGGGPRSLFQFGVTRLQERHGHNNSDIFRQQRRRGLGRETMGRTNAALLPIYPKRTFVEAAKSRLTIGSDCMIAPLNRPLASGLAHSAIKISHQSCR